MLSGFDDLSLNSNVVSAIGMDYNIYNISNKIFILKFHFNGNDTIVKTVVDININIDGSVKYHLKWFDGCGIKDVWLNENEISALEIVVEPDNTNITEHQKIGF